MDTQNAVPGSGPNVEDALGLLAEDGSVSFKDLLAIKTAHDAGNTAAIATLIPKLISDAKKDATDGVESFPLIKAGAKTSEFWLMVGVLLVQYVAYPLALHKNLPWYDTTAMDTLVALYAGSRHIQKNAVLKSPHVAGES